MTNSCDCKIHLPRSVSRRDLLKMSVAGAGIVALGPMVGKLPTASAAPQSLNRFVVINLFGGNDTTNMFIPIETSQYFDRRGIDEPDPADRLAFLRAETLSLDAGPHGTSKYVLHPAMPTVAQLWEDGDVAAIQRVGYPRANLSHFSSQDIFSLGVRDRIGPGGAVTSGWIARYADRHAPTPMGAASIGLGRPLDFVGGSTNPFLVNDLASFKLAAGGRRFNEQTPDHVHRLEAAKKMVERYSSTGNPQEAKNALSQAYDLADQVQAAVASYTSTAVYTNDAISRRLKDVARLIQGGFETRIFFTGDGGYDTHGNQGRNNANHARILGRLDASLAAFVQDMKDMGVWNDMVIAIITEFGRRNFVNGSGGTDHGHAWCELVIGGGVKGGLYGPDVTDTDLESDYLSYAVDFRAVYKEILGKHMGADVDAVFPEPLEITDQPKLL